MLILVTLLIFKISTSIEFPYLREHFLQKRAQKDQQKLNKDQNFLFRWYLSQILTLIESTHRGGSNEHIFGEKTHRNPEIEPFEVNGYEKNMVFIEIPVKLDKRIFWKSKKITVDFKRLYFVIAGSSFIKSRLIRTTSMRSFD